MQLQSGRPASDAGRLPREMQVYDALDAMGIPYERIDHAPADTMEVCRAIDDALGGKNKWDGVRFAVDKISRTSLNVGTLYRDSSYEITSNEVEADDYFIRSKIGNLYFVPEEAGTYEVDFAVYSDTDTKSVLATGKLTINVAVNLGAMDFRYITTVGEEIDLNEDDFAEYVQETLGIRYSLVYITLDGVSGDGTFRYDGSKYVPGRKSEWLYTEDAEDYYSVPRQAKLINYVSFSAPSKPGITYVDFTAYAVRGSAEPVDISGTFCIFYGYKDVPAITVRLNQSTAANTTLSTSVLNEEQFLEVYRSATGSTEKKPQFTVCFTELPTVGVLYKNYSTTRGTGTPMTKTDLNATSFTVGGSSSRSIATASYLVAYKDGISDSATYLASDSNGVPLYIGKINFTSATPKKVTITSEGYDFSAKDFENGGDPVEYVTFATPASGKLYVASGSRLIAITESTKLWTTDQTTGTQPIGATHYIPRAGQTADVTVTYTAHTKSGASYQNSIIFSTKTKTASDKFPDIPADVAKWAADSIDFASKYKFVQGDEKGNFMPRNGMRRCDLILIFYRMAGSPAVSGTMPYTDIADGTSSYAKEIYNSALWASQKGIVAGVVTGTEYKPKETVTRQEYICFLYNYTIAMGGNVAHNGNLNGFSDAGDVDAFALEAMKWAVARGYTTGTDAKNPKLSPKDETNRAQIVTFLYRYFSY